LVVDRAGQRASSPLEVDPPRWAVSSPLVADPAGRLASSPLVTVPVRQHLSAAMAKQHGPHPCLHPVRPNLPLSAASLATAVVASPERLRRHLLDSRSLHLHLRLGGARILLV
jgi:hypothetical protein